MKHCAAALLYAVSWLDQGRDASIMVKTVALSFPTPILDRLAHYRHILTLSLTYQIQDAYRTPLWEYNPCKSSLWINSSCLKDT